MNELASRTFIIINPPKTTVMSYVYTLAYPNGQVFYVGKGTGDRLRSHMYAARGKSQETRYQIIRAIWEQGGKPIATVVYDGVADHEACKIEKWLIEKYGYRQLSNKPFLTAKEWYKSKEKAMEQKRIYHGYPSIGDMISSIASGETATVLLSDESRSIVIDYLEQQAEVVKDFFLSEALKSVALQLRDSIRREHESELAEMRENSSFGQSADERQESEE
jgi:hypothetical protein